jgi:short-subunit dehydrogenase
MDFRGKTVLVTGSSGGLGQQLALDLCKKGAHLILVARRKTELEKTKQSCVAAGGASATVFVTDMNNTDSMKLLIASLSSTKLDVLLLNHGVGAVKRFVDYTERDFDLAETLFRINFHSYTRLVHGLLPNLNRDASVVAIGSMAGAVPGLYRTTYSPAKYALRSLWAGLRLELGEERGLFFTHVLPGYVLTGFVWGCKIVFLIFFRKIYTTCTL